MYGQIGYRQRYGTRLDYLVPHGYAGVGGSAGPIAVASGYGAPLTTTGHLAGYGAGAGDRVKKKPFWNTVGDVGLIAGLGALGVMTGGLFLPAALGATGILVTGGTIGAAVGAFAAGRRKKAKTEAVEKQIQVDRLRGQRDTSQARFEQAHGRLVAARDVRDEWRAVAEQYAPGLGPIGTAAMTAPGTDYALVGGSTGTALGEEAAGGSTGVYAVVGVGLIALLGAGAWFLTRNKRRV